MDTLSTKPLSKESKPTGKESRFPRRALIATAAVAGIGGVAVAAPRVAPSVEQHLEQAAIGELEGVSIDAALEAAELTRAAVQVIVLPVADLVAMLGSGALDVLLGALELAHNALALVRASTAAVDQLHAVVASWKAGLTALPIALKAYSTADISSAEAYLRALKKRVQ
jgi:hypothetical protein